MAQSKSIGYIGIMENKMETTIVYWGLYGDNGKENGNYYNGFYIGIMENQMEKKMENEMETGII